MKVKNIMFAGFAAAILMGTCGAARADDNKILTSKAYVDTEIGDVVDAQASKDSAQDALIQGNTNKFGAMGGKATVTEYVSGEVTTLQGSIDALNNGENSVATQIAGALQTAKGYADAAQAAAELTAANELTAHANTAEATYATKTELLNQNTTLTDAIATAKADAAADATSKANTAEANAKAYTDEEIGELGESENVVAYVEASQSEQNATLRGEIATAKSEAISAAATDATTKANAAQAAAEATAAGALATAKSALEGQISALSGTVGDLNETYATDAELNDAIDAEVLRADGKYATQTALSDQNTALTNAIATAKADAATDATTKATAAQAAAKEYTDTEVAGAEAATAAVASDLADLRTDLSQYSVVDGSGNTVALQSAYVAPAVIE